MLIFFHFLLVIVKKSEAKSSGIESAGEIEEQLKLFQEIVPDWISEKITSSGDVLVRYA